ncbi:hypothetical protein Micbo1qcDRAFT_179887 [Microdochium bolleyi]|uniref:Uncharacterized protein n=1 Tax=Microdochium bolleyi TaxID=196109 RepID=A0A136INC5_9PEZI|nr:hypothetical protein Micbo1qcDRAFT_179887 [Microdochium bolleyi]
MNTARFRQCFSCMPFAAVRNASASGGGQDLTAVPEMSDARMGLGSETCPSIVTGFGHGGCYKPPRSTMFSTHYFVTALCLGGAVLGEKPPVVPVEDAPSIITALFTDGNGRDSRADFTAGNWEFDGCA